MNDLISRQAAIDALKNRWKKTRNYEGIGDDIAEECELYLKQVPSTQLIQCKECVYGNKMKDTIRCELMDYLPVECDHFCSWAERIDNGVR